MQELKGLQQQLCPGPASAGSPGPLLLPKLPTPAPAVPACPPTAMHTHPSRQDSSQNAVANLPDPKGVASHTPLALLKGTSSTARPTGHHGATLCTAISGTSPACTLSQHQSPYRRAMGVWRAGRILYGGHTVCREFGMLKWRNIFHTLFWKQEGGFDEKLVRV
mmetsp:Transcript_9676/g.17026  ORF Transcript_9676/g.17026 Transcript_9676/m.17026 type:complete len:164 (-) Transcript_9676:134-625(-)